MKFSKACTSGLSPCFSLVRTSTDLTPLPPSGMKTAEAQTMFESGGLHYQWDPFASGFAFPGIPMGLGFVDPTPIATHMVSADALEGNYI